MAEEKSTYGPPPPKIPPQSSSPASLFSQPSQWSTQLFGGVLYKSIPNDYKLPIADSIQDLEEFAEFSDNFGAFGA